MPYGYYGQGKDVSPGADTNHLNNTGHFWLFRMVSWNLTEVFKNHPKRVTQFFTLLGYQASHTSLEGLDKCEMLTRNDVKATPHGTGGWSGPKDQQNKTDKFLSIYGVNSFLKSFIHHIPVCNGGNVSEHFFMEWIPVYFLHLAQISMTHLIFPLKKRMSFFISSSKAKKWFLLIFEIQFPMFLFFTIIQYSRK